MLDVFLNFHAAKLYNLIDTAKRFCHFNITLTLPLNNLNALEKVAQKLAYVKYSLYLCIVNKR